ncbi:MAG: flavin reductase family protein [Candidatus Caldatribacteriota bacterium]|jgi:flavin reductase (DIM6/NTAB) family NADH-FMN oxidoreductase RutF|nr:flavin reductase family protein [Atribacterota bacterium]MDD3030850.1 flavin reductase family protein [Atribacterota bacterium]MDD3640241.1 flavin reductase family protein [Atribacterota bacterium]MDD4288258.1 flavin reductase family protein [Atribacterota bacterium]MDD4764893.1 flavin reductase family protein [Atribacterota bacterium]
MKKSIGPKTLLGAVPVLVVGSYDQENKPNLATVAWGGICNSEPPCVNISLRKNRYSYRNIISRKVFTVNVLFNTQVREADFYGISSGAKYNKFEKTRITPVKSEIVDAPYGEEFPMVLECRVINQIEIGSHVMFVGEILDVKIENSLLDEDGKFNKNKIKPILYIPTLGEYFTMGEYLGKGHSIGRKYISS